MPPTHNALIDQLLIPALFVFFLIAGIAGTALGAALIIFRGRVFQLSSPMNRWVSGRAAMAPLEKVHSIDSIVYKYRRWFSAAFIIGAAFSMIMIVAKMDAASLVTLFGAGRLASVGPWLVESVRWMLLIGCALAIVVGIILGFFPHALGVLERRTNHWYSSRQLGRGVDDMHLSLDKWVEHSPRTAGWIISIAALIVAVNSAIILLRR